MVWTSSSGFTAARTAVPILFNILSLTTQHNFPDPPGVADRGLFGKSNPGRSGTVVRCLLRDLMGLVMLGSRSEACPRLDRALGGGGEILGRECCGEMFGGGIIPSSGVVVGGSLSVWCFNGDLCSLSLFTSSSSLPSLPDE